jgi:hypothetical protein
MELLMGNEGTAAQAEWLRLSYSEQLVVMLAFQAGKSSAFIHGDIARRLSECAKNDAVRQVWTKFDMDTQKQTPLTDALIQTGLFTPDVEMLLGVIQAVEPATKAVIDYLSVIVHRPREHW